MFNYSTDMADERRDIYKKVNNLEEISGVETEIIDEGENIKTNRVKIINKDGEKSIGKPIGTYITIDVNNLKIADNESIKKASTVVTKELKSLLNKYIQEKDDVLIVGLGNEYVTPDSLRT